MEIGGTAINTEVHAVEKVISKQLPANYLWTAQHGEMVTVQRANIASRGTD